MSKQTILDFLPLPDVSIQSNDISGFFISKRISKLKMKLSITVIPRLTRDPLNIGRLRVKPAMTKIVKFLN